MPVVKIDTSPDIFMVSAEYSNGIFGETNCYVIHDQGEWLIIDTGYPDESVRAVLQKELDAIGVNWDKIACFVTHRHLDHAGLVDRIIPAGAHVYVSKRSYDFFHQDDIGDVLARLKKRLRIEGATDDEVAIFGSVFEKGLAFHAENYDMTSVKEGDVIRVGGAELQVVELSGHAFGQVGLMEPLSRTLFCGDHVLQVVSPSVEISFFGADSIGEYLANLNRVKKLSIKRLAWGHGALSDDFSTRIDYLIAHNEKRVKTAELIIKNRPGLCGTDIVKLMNWNVPYPSWAETPVLQRGVILSEGLAVIDHLVAQGACARGGNGGYYACGPLADERFAAASR